MNEIAFYSRAHIRQDKPLPQRTNPIIKQSFWQRPCSVKLQVALLSCLRTSPGIRLVTTGEVPKNARTSRTEQMDRMSIPVIDLSETLNKSRDGMSRVRPARHGIHAGQMCNMKSHKRPSLPGYNCSVFTVHSGCFTPPPSNVILVLLRLASISVPPP